jgi:O-antigen/teichoic acid export membrane protein
VAAVFAHLSISRWLLPRLVRPRIEPALIRPLLRFGVGLVASTIATMLLVNIEKLLLPRFASVTALAHYAVAYSVAGMLALVPNAIRQTLLPAFSRLNAEGDRDSLERLYLRALRSNLLWIAPASVLLVVGAKPFFTLWAGPEFGEHSAVPFYVLIGGLLFNVIAYVPYTLLLALGRSNLIARFHLAELLPYLVCAAALTYWYGAIGAALAFSLRVTVDSLLLLLAARRISGFSPSVENRASYLVALSALSLPLLLIGNAHISWALVMGTTLLSLSIYSSLVWMRVLSAEERAWLTTMLVKRRSKDGV